MTRTRSLVQLKLLVFLTIIIGSILHTVHVVHHWNISQTIAKTAGESKRSDIFYKNTISTKKEMDALQKPRIENKDISQVDILTERLDICKSMENIQIDLFIFIMSRYGEHSLRDTIRKTWLSSSIGNKSRVRYIFLLARDEFGIVTGAINREVLIHKDVVMYDVIDSYQNLTLKTMLGMHFATTFCKSAKYVMKTDSDVYVNLPPLLQMLRWNTTRALIGFGLLRPNDLPIRNETGVNRKWFVSNEEFPEPTYPPYFDGMGYIIQTTVVQDLVKVFPDVPFFKFEDVYIGMCLQRLGLRLKATKGFVRSDSVLTVCSHKATTVYAVHGVAQRQISAVWRLNCTGMTNAVLRKPRNLSFKWIKT